MSRHDAWVQEIMVLCEVLAEYWWLGESVLLIGVILRTFCEVIELVLSIIFWACIKYWIVIKGFLLKITLLFKEAILQVINLILNWFLDVRADHFNVFFVLI